MTLYGEFLRNLKRGTTFHDRRGKRKTKLGQYPQTTQTVHAHPKSQPVSACRRFFLLSWPAACTLGVGVLFHMADIHDWMNMSLKVPFGFFPIVMVPLCLVFAAQAFGAVDTKLIRFGAGLLNLAYPVFLARLLVAG